MHAPIFSVCMALCVSQELAPWFPVGKACSRPACFTCRTQVVHMHTVSALLLTSCSACGGKCASFETCAAVGGGNACACGKLACCSFCQSHQLAVLCSTIFSWSCLSAAYCDAHCWRNYTWACADWVGHPSGTAFLMSRHTCLLCPPLPCILQPAKTSPQTPTAAL